MSKSIRGLLAFAASSSLVLAQGETKAPNGQAAGGGWSAKPGAGLKFDGGDAFSLELKNRLQVHWTYANNEDDFDSNNFDIRRARTSLGGHVFEKTILYYLQLDHADAGASLKQGWSQWNFSSSESGTVGLRAGQAKTMFGLEATTSSAGLWFVERSSASRAFADSYSRGAWVNGVMAENRFRWTAGAMNGDVAAAVVPTNLDAGEEADNSDNELSYVFAANFDPMGDFFGGKQTTESFRQGDWRTDDKSLKGTIGAGIALGNGKTLAGNAGPDIESTSINLNTAWTVERFNLLGEFFMRTDDVQGAADEEEPTGFAVSGGYLLEKSGDSAIQWGLGLRVNMISLDEGAAGSGISNFVAVQGITAADLAGDCDVTEVSVVANAFYHGHPCKTQFEWTFQDVDPSGAASSRTNHIFRVAFQIEF